MSGPIRNLQHMLRSLSQADIRLVPVTPDGLYGQNTCAAVTAFQRCRGLPTTGSADLATWEAVVRDFDAQCPPFRTVHPGERSGWVNTAQSCLRTLKDAFGALPPVDMTGYLDAPTVAALRRFQALCGLPITGVLDGTAMDALTRFSALAAECKNARV